MEYVQHIIIMFAVFSVLAVSLDLLAGHCGVLSICHAGFWGIGAYSSALFSLRLGLPFTVGLVLGMIFAGVVSIAISLPSFRMRDDNFIIATFAFQIILFSIFNNWMGLTRGPLGIPGIPQPVIFGWQVNSPCKFLSLGCLLAVLAYVVVMQLSSSPFGRVLHAIREDDMFAKSMGKNILYFKVTAFAVSASLAAMTGSLYAHYITYIDPTSFTVNESILILSMVIIGGAGSKWGPVIGAVVLVVLPEALRFVGLPSSVAANMRQIIYGALLVIMMMFRPRGLVGNYGFGR